MKILIVKTHAIGDLLLVTPSIRAIRGLFPDAEISLLTGAWSAPVLQNNPYIDEIISVDDDILFQRKWMAIWGLVRRLKRKHYDLAFILQPSGKIRFMVFSAMIKERIGLAFEGKGFFLTDPVLWEPKRSRYIAENYLDVVRKVGKGDFDTVLDLFLTDDEIMRAERFLKERGIDSRRKLIGIAPGGGKNPRDYVPMKLWGRERFVEVIRKVRGQFDVGVVLFGSEHDREICGYIRSNTPEGVIDTSGEVDLRGLMALIKRCELLLTNDSAPVHFAIALGTPTVTLFGPTNPYTLLPNDPNHVAITSTVNCSPCYSHEAFPGCDAPCCMDYIDVETVFNVVAKKLS